jgi:hypothetical protein
MQFSYWDPELKPESYSYVDAALGAGYSILIYDRLGTGQSEKPDAYDIVQGPPHIEILNQLIVLARAVLERGLQAAAVLSNYFWLTKGLAQRGSGLLEVLYGFGGVTKVPTIGSVGIIVVSLLLATFIVSLLTLALYASHTLTWTGSLNAFD